MLNSQKYCHIDLKNSLKTHLSIKCLILFPSEPQDFQKSKNYRPITSNFQFKSNVQQKSKVNQRSINLIIVVNFVLTHFVHNSTLRKERLQTEVVFLTFYKRMVQKSQVRSGYHSDHRAGELVMIWGILSVWGRQIGITDMEPPDIIYF